MGEIHVDSALNEPLAAEIDIVGATPDELVGLIATVANRETFSHFGAERPTFLNTTTFKVTQDASGKPVLAIRSSDSFTEPLIDFVVDLRWRNGQLIRQYSLLLDPAGYPAATQSATALPVPPTQSALAAPLVTAATAPGSSAASTVGALPITHLAPHITGADAGAASDLAAAAGSGPTQIKVAANATLHGIASRLGARSNADLDQMMIAIYRANPSAFDGNINRLRLGATLKIPSAQEIGSISHADANRETHAQMQAWRDGSKRSTVSVAANKASAAAATAPSAASTGTATGTAANTSANTANPSPAANEATAAVAHADPMTSAATTAVTAPNAAPPPASAYVATAAPSAAAPAAAPKGADENADKAALTSKIVMLEGSLQEIQAQLAAQHDKLLTMQAQVRYAEQHPPAAAAPAAVEASNRGLLTAALAGMAVLAGLCVALLVRLRRRNKTSALPSIEKVPAMAPMGALPVAKAKPAPVNVRPPLPTRIEVHEEPAEPYVEEVRTPKAELPPEETHEPNESALELSIADTAGINASKLREELAAAKLREEIAAAWALPSAESYKREDLHPESTLAQDIAQSLEDTMNLEAAKVTDEGDTIEEEAYTDTISDTGNLVGASGETASFTATEVLPDSTMKMSASDFPNEIDPDQLDYNFMDLELPSDTEAADTVNMKGHAETSATDKIKITGEIKLAATGEIKLAAEELKLGADDPKLSSIEQELASWAKKSA